MAGRAYAAGGIRTTVAATRAASDDELRANATRLRAEMRRQGTTTVEIKSGYGLTVADEAARSRSPASSPTRSPTSAPTWSRRSSPTTPTATSRW
jgi:imidazolonepropionase